MRRLPAEGLLRCAIAPGIGRNPVADADIAGKSVGGLLENAWLACFPAEAAEHRLLVLDRPYPVGTTGDAIAITVVGILVRENILGRNRFDKSEPDHLRRHARRGHRFRMQGPIAEVLDTVGRPPERDDLTARERDRHLLVADDHAPLAGMALDAELLKLRAIGRLGYDRDTAFRERCALLVRLGRDRQAQEHRHRAILDVRPTRRLAAAVLQVAALAGARVVERPEPVRRFGRRGRGNPELAEDAIADLEVELLGEPHVRREV